MNQKISVDIKSEVSPLEAVIVHTPGPEVENMRPHDAERALYSDILNLSVARKEYSQFKGVLEKHASVLEVKDLLEDILQNPKVKNLLIERVCFIEGNYEIQSYLEKMDPKTLSHSLIEGVILPITTFSRYLCDDRYLLPPLHNFFFTRDASISIGNEVFIAPMANKVRMREAIIMEAIFDYHPNISTKTVNPNGSKNSLNNKNEKESLNNKSLKKGKLSFEGGDIIVVREDVLCIGMGARTTSQGIDFILEHFRKQNKKQHLIVQELPETPESFIHLDMVFTLLDRDKCMIFDQLLLRHNRYQTFHIEINNGKVIFHEEENILIALKKLGIDLEPISCGGFDPWTQEREQWHSGANFFSMGPGKIIGYGRNIYTLEALSQFNFEIIKAKDVISDKVNLSTYSRYVVIIEGAELSRGGGGCRCMSMPIRRDEK
ncbi:arginine deiminase [bacterium]|nr:arginine deiminase [bacterium]